MDMLVGILNLVQEGDAFEGELDDESIKLKVAAIKKIANYFHVLRQESITLLELKGLTPTDHAIFDVHGPDEDGLHNALEEFKPASGAQAASGGGGATRNRLGSAFDLVREADLRNERMPLNYTMDMGTPGGAHNSNSSSAQSLAHPADGKQPNHTTTTENKK